MNRRAAVLLFIAGLSAQVPGRPPVSILEVRDTVRALAAAEIGVKKKDINMIQSLADQGFDERSLRSLIVSVQQEFGVVISEQEMFEARAREPAVPLSVRVIADLVMQHQRDSQW